MKKILNIFVAMLVPLVLAAQAPANYYDASEGKSGAELKTTLFNIIKDHTELSYAYLWTAFRTTDAKANGKVWDMYANTNYTFGADQGASYNAEGQTYNREHSFPKSWFDDAAPMYTDLFHLYPVDGYVNSQRSNYPFGNVRNVRYTSSNGSKLGSPSTGNFASAYVFEPAAEYKGDFARTYFYMATCYENKIAGWRDNNAATRDILDGNSFPAFKPWYIDLLIEWHKADPVSEKEINRNNAVYQIQGNRNPYIDHPEWVECVWKDICQNQATIIMSDIKYSPAIPDETSSVSVSTIINIYGDDSLSSTTLQYGTSATALNTSVPMTLADGRHSAQIPPFATGTEVFFQIRAISAGGASKGSNMYSYTVVEAIPDLIIASLAHSPANPQADETVSISSEVYTVKDEINTVMLHWQTNESSTETTAAMTGSNSTYTATIPSHPNGTVITYRVQAATAGGIVRTSEVKNYMVNVRVEPDDIVIENITYSPANPKVNESLTISADVYCNTTSASALLRWYDLSSPSATYTRQMQNVLGNSFSTTIFLPDNPTSVCFQILGQAGTGFAESALRCISIAVSQPGISGNLLQLTEPAGIDIIEVYTNAGQRVFAKKYAGDTQATIDISSFAGGAYIIRIRTVAGNYTTTKVIF